MLYIYIFICYTLCKLLYNYHNFSELKGRWSPDSVPSDTPLLNFTDAANTLHGMEYETVSKKFGSIVFETDDSTLTKMTNSEKKTFAIQEIKNIFPAYKEV